jgi:hypothetical protein
MRDSSSSSSSSRIFTLHLLCHALQFYTGGDITVGVPANSQATQVGFLVSNLCADNTLVNPFAAQSITFVADASLFQNRPFDLTDLYYWDAATRTWKLETRCTGAVTWTPLLEVYQIQFSICNSGEVRLSAKATCTLVVGQEVALTDSLACSLAQLST